MVLGIDGRKGSVRCISQIIFNVTGFTLLTASSCASEMTGPVIQPSGSVAQASIPGLIRVPNIGALKALITWRRSRDSPKIRNSQNICLI